MSEKSTNNKEFKFKSIREALDSYAGILELFAEDSSKDLADAALELREEIYNQFGEDDFDMEWALRVTSDRDEDVRFRKADEVEEQLRAERMGGSFDQDSDRWDNDAYEFMHDGHR